MLCNKIVIIGAGLMGSSLYEAIKQHSVAKQVILLAKDKSQLKTLAQLGIANTTVNYQETKDAAIVVIATPLFTYETIFKNLIAGGITNHTIITDIGSVKEPVEELVKKHFRHLTFVPSHPIAGSHKSGVGAIVNDLYEYKKVIITGNKDSKETGHIASFWQKIGMKIQYMDSKTHDNIYANISHLVQKIAFNTKSTLEDMDLDILSLAKTINNKEFNQFVRLTFSNPKIWDDIFSANSKYLSSASNSFVSEIHAAAAFVQNNQFIKLYERIQTSKIHMGESISFNSDFEIEEKDFLYFMFGAIVASSLIHTIRDQSFFNYIGSGFKDLVAIKNTIKQQDILKFTRIKYDLTIMLREFSSNFK